MSVITYPLNEIDYKAEDAELYLCTRTSGVYSADDNFAITLKEGYTFEVGTGIAWIRNMPMAGKVVASDTPLTLSITTPDSTLDRIDRVVIRFDRLQNSSSIVVKTGLPGTEPVAPDRQTDDDAYELVLYDIQVPHGLLELTDANITDRRIDESVCGIMRDGVTGIPTEQLAAQVYTRVDEITAQSYEVLDALEQAFADVLADNLPAHALMHQTSDPIGMHYSTTLPANAWTGDSAPYTQTVTVYGMSATDRPIVDVALTGTTGTDTAILEAWGMVSRITTTDGSITATCYEDKPEVDIPIQMEVIR